MLAAVKIVFLASLALPTGQDTSNGEPAVAQLSEPDSAAPNAVAAADATKQTAETPAATVTTAMADAGQAAGALAHAATVDQVSAAAGEQAAMTPTRADSVNAARDDAQAALASASARSATSVPRLLGASVAYAAELPAAQPIVPPAPNVRPVDSPIAPRQLGAPAAPQQQVVRPDEMTPQDPPAPHVSPFVSRDSAAQKQAELNRREQELLALQQQMESRMDELHSLESRLQGMLNDANTTQDSKFKQLVDMYANMKPRQAAQALSSVDETVAVKILTGMKSKQSGEIMSYMDSENAARLSEVMSKMEF